MLSANGTCVTAIVKSRAGRRGRRRRQGRESVSRVGTVPAVASALLTYEGYVIADAIR